MRVWRISKKRHASTAFSGEGARLASARWNFAGVPMVYTSTFLSLALVEVLVHLNPLDEPDFVSIAAELPVDVASLRRDGEALLTSLPSDWRRVGHLYPRKIGSAWATSGRSLALMVPSVVVDGEWNILINKLHPDARRITLDKPRPMQFDQRLFKLKS